MSTEFSPLSKVETDITAESSRNAAYRAFISPETYGINEDDLAVITYDDLKSDSRIKHVKQSENGNISIASHMPLLFLMNSQQDDIGRVYLSFKDSEALKQLVTLLSERDLFFQIKVSTDTKRVDQVCLYVKAPNNNEADVISALQDYYENNKDLLNDVALPFAATLLDQNGERAKGINFKQGTKAKDSPNAFAASAVLNAVKSGGGKNAMLAYLKEKAGYSLENPAFLDNNNDFPLFKQFTEQNPL